MEKVTFQNSRNLKLVGCFYPSDSKNVIIISHGFAANKDRTRLITAAEKFSNEGCAVLRYDAGGSGESDDSPVTIKNYYDDLKSAIKYVRDKGYENIGLLGESFGGLTSILAYDENIKSLVLWSPVIDSMVSTLYEENKKEIESKGFIIYKKDGREFKIPKEYFDEKIAVNQKEILSGIKTPVLLFYGSEDDTIPFEDCENALKYLPKDSKLEVIKGAGHKLEEDIDRVINLSLGWFKKYLK
ncbi:alpha/beta hydrolase [archaeon]|nr:alpha/beta hydrolase [archaeon]